MLRLSLLLASLVSLTHPHVTKTPFTAQLGKFYEKLERLTLTPPKARNDFPESLTNHLYSKLKKLDELSPADTLFNDDDEELLSAIQSWERLNADQLDGVAKELQRLRDEDVSDRITDNDYADIEDNDEEYMDEGYHNDAKEQEQDEVDFNEPSSYVRAPFPVTPSAFTREEGYRHTFISAVDPIAATNDRPKILDDSALTSRDRMALRQAALKNMKRVVKNSKCLVPQPRWFTVKQLAPAADIGYMPPCVELHRCAPDSGCCNSEAEVCAPILGEHVALPFYLHKADGNISVARMLFFNHTRCACVSRSTKQAVSVEPAPAQNDWRPLPTPIALLTARPTAEPNVTNDDEATSPPQLKRCTCPTLFFGSIEKNVCVCTCDWPEGGRRRECLSFARGREHFGLRDRVCISEQNCVTPRCDYGAYDHALGTCPARKFRRLRYHSRTRFNHSVFD